jgi:hypothetical protein
MTNSQTSSVSSNASKIALLAKLELERRRRSKPGLTFRGAAEVIQSTTAREWIISGPSETGKTFAALYKLHQMAQAYPGSRWVIMRKTAESLTTTAVRSWKRVIRAHGTKPEEFGGTRPYLWVYPNGSVVNTAGMDNPDKILSGEFDGIYVNQCEELSKEEWETITTRTTGRGAVTPYPMAFGDANPKDPEHWILERSRSGQLQIYTSRHEDNPSLHDGTDWTDQGRRTLATLDALTGTRYARLRLGEWVYADDDESFLGSISMWDGCIEEALPPLSPRQPIVLGMDAAISGDTFALVGVGRYGAQADQMLALRMVKVWEPNGTPLDYGQIEQDIRAIIKQYNVVQIAYDPYQAHYLAQRLSDAVWCEPFSQQARRLESDAALRQLIMTRRLVHNGEHTIVRQHLMNANAKVDETGHRLRIVKRDTSNKIDSVVALSMAAHAALGLNLY